MLTPSTMLPLGTRAPLFTLPEAEGGEFSIQDSLGKKPVLVMFICNHCPYVKHIRKGLSELTTEYLAKGVAIYGICSNDAVNYPEDSLPKMLIEKKSAGYAFPYLFDADQSVARDYQAACTPDFYVFDKVGVLAYRGQMDDSRPGNGMAVTGKDLREALDAVLRGGKVSNQQRPSIGCNIKWKKGNEPHYAK